MGGKGERKSLCPSRLPRQIPRFLFSWSRPAVPDDLVLDQVAAVRNSAEKSGKRTTIHSSLRARFLEIRALFITIRIFLYRNHANYATPSVTRDCQKLLSPFPKSLVSNLVSLRHSNNKCKFEEAPFIPSFNNLINNRRRNFRWKLKRRGKTETMSIFRTHVFLVREGEFLSIRFPPFPPPETREFDFTSAGG